MSESMAIEKLAESYISLDGYFTETRVPYIAKLDKEGLKKKGKQPGDIDVIGINIGIKGGKLIAIEIKGYGTIESYDSWCNSGRLYELYDLSKNLSGNVEKILSKKWDKVFQRKKKFDKILIFIPGTFYPKGHMNLKKNSYHGHKFVKKIIRQMEKKFHNNYSKNNENDALDIVEKVLKNEFKIEIEVIPIHTLIQKLILKVKKDMQDRRKRYPDTALETFRWLIKCVEHEALDLNKLQEELKKLK